MVAMSPRRRRPGRARAATIILLALCFGSWAVLTFHPGVTFDNRPQSLWAHLPSDGTAGVPLALTVQAWDWAERVSASYRGTLTFSLESYDSVSLEPLSPGAVTAYLPDAPSFTGSPLNLGGIPNTWLPGGRDYGIRAFELVIETPGLHYVRVTDDQGRVALSNPVLVRAAETSGGPDASAERPRSLVWGDVHTHTIFSDGSGLPGFLLRIARDYSLLDFTSITDHGEMTLSTTPRYGWIIDWVARASERFNDPGRFVVLHGVEWTTAYGWQGVRAFGHYAIVTDGPVPLHVARTLQQSPDELWAYLDSYRAANGEARVAAIPHHLTQTNFEMDWAAINPEYVKTVEVFSVHGDGMLLPNDPLNHLGMCHVSHEPTPGASAADAFRMGRRVAMVADSDSHDGYPGHSLVQTATHWPSQWPWQAVGVRAGHPYRGGLTGAWVGELTRIGVLEAMHTGNVMGTSAPFRPVVAFSVNGCGPGLGGNVITVPTVSSPRTITLNVARDGLERSGATAWPELTVELWKNSELLRTATVKGAGGSFTFVDDTPVTGTTYTGAVQDTEGVWRTHARAALPVDPTELNTGGADYYFVRLHSPAGFWAWAGPVWVETASAGPGPGEN